MLQVRISVVTRLVTILNQRAGIEMKIAVVAANGKSGKLIVKEAVDRGFDVTAIARSDNKTAAKKFLKKDLMDLTAGIRCSCRCIWNVQTRYSFAAFSDVETSLRYFVEI